MSKREEQRKIREQKQKEAAARQKRQQFMTKLAMYVLAPLVLAAVVYTYLGQGEVYSPVEISETDHTRGNPNGLPLVVYADFQCPACANEYQHMTQAWNRISSDVQLVFRHFPLSNAHPHAWTAASYAEAAGRQGKFWEMYDALFVNQSYWSTLSPAAVEMEFDGYLTLIGVDLEQAHLDLEDETLTQKIRNDQRGGNRSGVRSTPTLFLDGKLMPIPRSARDIINMVAEAKEA
ncbi:MAG: thioredoxin domain-containing protein [Pseudohongiellaceae bacterium]|nr:thioredoxin domain-containing protein [Pseudohongiellaceae bacterium]